MSQNNHHSTFSSVKSPTSLKSMGMGDQVPQPTPCPKTQDHPRPLPEGMLTSNEPLYDCVIYVIFCPEHQNIAITNVVKCKCVWLPFVPLPDGVTWNTASHDGVSILIGRNDAEMDAEEAERKSPKYIMSFLNLLRLTLPSKKVVLRLAQFVRLESNPFFECCRNTERVNWLPLSDIQQTTNCISRLWGPELMILTTELLTKQELQFIQEFGAPNIVHYLHLNGSWQQELLKTFKLTEKHVYEIFTDFIDHTYPSMYMCLESLRVYFLKYGLVYTETQLSALFNAFCQSEEKRPFVDFHDFLTSLLSMEPNCPNKLEARNRLIFRYYDCEQKGQLDEKNICNLLKDAYPEWPDAKIAEEARLHLKNRPFLSFDELKSTFKTSVLRVLCRSSQSMLKNISYSLACKKKNRARLNQACEGALKAIRTTKGTCWACLAQQFEYGQHMVTIDTVGRCVEPTIIPVTKGRRASSTSKPQPGERITQSRFSLEYMFSGSSVPNIFLDLVRDFHTNAFIKKDAHLVAIMAQPQDWHIFHKYLRILCNDLNAVLGFESKLLKINAPAIVVGDLLGNLHDLMTLEKQFWQGFPVVPESLIFLGNYTGQNYSHGIECLIYLFALKLCSPNKVFLLRGVAELDARTSNALKKQCTAKYGTEHGQIIFAIVLQMFTKLPIAAVLDDSILCTHSGIPSGRRLVTPLLKLPKEMATVQRDSVMAYEIITRVPKDNSFFDDACSGQNGNMGNKTPIDVAQTGNTHCKLDACKKVKPVSMKTDTKSKSIKYPSPTAMKSIPLTYKSFKSIKSMKTNSPLKAFDTTKSIKSQKSCGSKKRTLLPSMQEQWFKAKSESGSGNGNVHTPQGPFHFEIGANLLPKSKPTFLVKYRKVVRKVKKHKSARSHTQTGHQKSKKTPKSPDKGKPRSMCWPNCEEENTFGEQEFAEFMAANDLAYLVRSGSLCRVGFAFPYKHCISIFSCSNFARRNNQASVALIDGYSVRVVRHSISCVNDPTISKVANNNNNNNNND